MIELSALRWGDFLDHPGGRQRTGVAAHVMMEAEVREKRDLKILHYTAGFERGRKGHRTREAGGL